MWNDLQRDKEERQEEVLQVTSKTGKIEQPSLPSCGTFF